MATVFSIRCDNPRCPFEPEDGFRYATMPEVGPNLFAMAPIQCSCGLQVNLVTQVEADG